jgi:hypothetical protein
LDKETKRMRNSLSLSMLRLTIEQPKERDGFSNDSDPSSSPVYLGWSLHFTALLSRRRRKRLSVFHQTVLIRWK